MSEIREIGGYFGFERFARKEYYEDLIAVNSGRNALLYILEARNIRKLYLPRFLCDSVLNLCIREGVEFEEYAVGKDFLPQFDKDLKQDEYLYIVNFYGQITNDSVAEMKRRWGNIIFDNVQAFFQRPVKGIDTVYSCRKFFGVPDGGYVYTEALYDRYLETDVSKDRMKHILGRFEETASEYYEDFKANDSLLAHIPLRKMSALTRNILKAVDYDAVRTKRGENYALLESALGALNGLELKAPEGPYAYPFYCENGMEIKKKLAQKKIYVATLWPNVIERGGILEKEMAENILPLPCDQRYDAEDMARIIEAVKELIY